MTDHPRSARARLAAALRRLARRIDPAPTVLRSDRPLYLRPYPDDGRGWRHVGEVCTCRFTGVRVGLPSRPVRHVDGCDVHDLSFRPGALTDTL